MVHVLADTCCRSKDTARQTTRHLNIASATNRNLESTQLPTTWQLSLGVLSFGVAEKNPLNLIEVILAQGSWSGSSPQRMTFR
jgi:hypothetical protein